MSYTPIYAYKSPSCNLLGPVSLAQVPQVSQVSGSIYTNPGIQGFLGFRQKLIQKLNSAINNYLHTY